ncbi:Peptidase M20, dimerization domain [Pseudocohnilembus persalinus]|uniref:Peptidase M20, dimerization domain n=1 Tax=Pseudocohnilembus persalinus TaxID=266149 RepID=A0A0V0R1M6_PSEPJ|nr:Peptidase M20, dimerization domain [Pseudocohnilembus persalinus]|eukprot:KRX08428.1 Peptidase M20, dimerization domain [Pseudocohnilembus persalinus]
MQQQHQQHKQNKQQSQQYIQDHIQETVNDSKLKIQEVHLRPEVLEIEHELITMRRHFHMHPETAYEEIETAGYIVQKLKELKNIEIIEKVGKTGVVGVLRGGKNSGKGKCIMLRADMDALNLKENTGEEFSSKYSGKHHACGHDGHMAMLLGAAQILSKWQNKIEGDIKFCFQPAEEGYAGAKAMIQDEKYPVLQNPKVDEAYGIHLFNSKYYPHVSAQTGPMTANSDFCEIKIIGTGSSAYMPHYSQDAVYISSQLINSLYGITSRNIDPVSHQSISIGTINGGTAANIIASECSLKISVRTTTEKQRKIQRSYK